jgi:hypothetical protein
MVLEYRQTQVIPEGVGGDLFGVVVVGVVAEVDELAQDLPVVRFLFELLPIEMMGCP